MLVGFAVAIIWPQVYDASQTGLEIYNLPPPFAPALITNVIVSALSRPRNASTDPK